MNTRYYMVIIKGEIKTSEIMSCGYNRNNQKWDVKFNNGKTYSYAYLNVEKLTDPEVLNPNMYRISREGRELGDLVIYAECKKKAPKHPVNVGLVRQLYGTVEADRVTAGIMVTNSYFSKDARRFQQTIKSRMNLMDYSELMKQIMDCR